MLYGISSSSIRLQKRKGRGSRLLLLLVLFVVVDYFSLAEIKPLIGSIIGKGT